MNWKKFILLSCVLPCVFAVSTATAQMRGGHRASMARMPMRGAPMRGSMARMPMQRGPMLNSAFGFHRFNDGDFDRGDRFRRFNRFNDFDRDDRFRRFNRFNDFDRDDRFRRFHHHHNFNDIIVFDNFGFPFFPAVLSVPASSIPSILITSYNPYPYGDYYHPHGYGAYQGGYSVNDSLPKRLSFSRSFSMV
jgi:hypothetical protein